MPPEGWTWRGEWSWLHNAVRAVREGMCASVHNTQKGVLSLVNSVNTMRVGAERVYAGTFHETLQGIKNTTNEHPVFLRSAVVVFAASYGFLRVARGPAWKQVRNTLAFGGSALALAFPKETVRFFLWPYHNLSPSSGSPPPPS